MSKRGQDEMMRAIDVLAKAVPNGELFAAMGPLPFLGAAADHIDAQRAALATGKAEVTALKYKNDACRAEIARLNEERNNMVTKNLLMMGERDESVRALAVSQGEVARMELGLGLIAEERDAVRGDLERARELLALAHGCKPGSCDTSICRIGAFLAPPSTPPAPSPTGPALK